MDEFARVHRVAPRDLECLTFALGEAVANAIVHARARGEIEVHFRADGDSIVATVVDRGEGFVGPPRGLVPFPDGFMENGRGFAIMQRCTDFFDVSSRPGEGTIVTLGRYRHDGEEFPRRTSKPMA